MIQLHTTLLLAQSILGVHLVGLQLAVPRLQLGHPGLEPRHPTDGGAPLGQLLGGLLRQLHKSLKNNYALQDNACKNKSASQMERGR